MLKSQQPEDPTYEVKETDPTDCVVDDATGSSTLTKPDLKKYNPPKNIINSNMAVNIVFYLFTTILFLFGISLNREVGISSEKTNQNTKAIDEIKIDVKNINENFTNLKIKLEVLNQIDIKNKTKP